MNKTHRTLVAAAIGAVGLLALVNVAGAEEDTTTVDSGVVAVPNPFDG
ncbi:MAG: hypothetical protein ACRDZ3_18440 [Acidimicrobiia bacterium]